MIVKRQKEFAENAIDEAKSKSKTGAGMLAAGIGTAAVGSGIANSALKDIKDLGAFQKNAAKTQKLLENSKSLSQAKRILKNSSSARISGKFAGGAALKATGIGLGLAGAGKMIYDNCKKK